MKSSIRLSSYIIIWGTIFVATLVVLCVVFPSKPEPEPKPSHPCQVEDQLDTPAQQQSYDHAKIRLDNK